LHAGRISAAGAIYFVTLVTQSRMAWLSAPTAAEAMVDVTRRWHDEIDGSVLATSVMPDHVHVLFSLGLRLDVGRCVSRWKSLARRATGYQGAWQRDFWEHRLRADEDLEGYGLYVFLNPYRAGLVGKNEVWPWTWIPEWERFRFSVILDSHGAPPEEWIDWPDERFIDLKTGE
jgi:REP element-mobilizing transposase RayT